ncbi:MAG: hypothetical protein ABJA71_02785 [Ginsengibacter sp.]
MNILYGDVFTKAFMGKMVSIVKEIFRVDYFFPVHSFPFYIAF